MRVLYVEDSERLQRSVSRALQQAAYAVDLASTGPEGLWQALAHDYDVIILDLMLPGLDGLSLLRRLRQEGKDAHVLILTAKDAVEDRIAGLRTGADDYLIKPFSIDELLARIEALVRRRHGAKDPCLNFGDLELDTVRRLVSRGGKSIELSPREYALLHFLALHVDEVVSRTRIEAAIYDDKAEPMSNVVDAAIYGLRKKLDRPGEPSLLVTRRGMGYVFSPRRKQDQTP